MSDPEEDELHESMSSQAKGRLKPRARQKKTKGTAKNRKKSASEANSPNDIDAEGETDQEDATETQVSEARSRLRRRSKVDYAALERNGEEEDYVPIALEPKKKRGFRTSKAGLSNDEAREKTADSARLSTDLDVIEDFAGDTPPTEGPTTG